jgi:hypothetical protein
MKSARIAIAGLAAVVVAGAAATAAHAGCYEGIGCTDRDYFARDDLRRFGCQELAFIRNGIYAEHGYCLKNADNKLLFGNRGCRYESPDDVPLSRAEQRNIKAIADVERQKDCR